MDCQPQKVPASGQLEDGQLPDLLEQFDARQLLHVTFGSILDAVRSMSCTRSFRPMKRRTGQDWKNTLRAIYGRFAKEMTRAVTYHRK